MGQRRAPGGLPCPSGTLRCLALLASKSPCSPAAAARPARTLSPPSHDSLPTVPQLCCKHRGHLRERRAKNIQDENTGLAQKSRLQNWRRDKVWGSTCAKEQKERLFVKTRRRPETEKQGAWPFSERTSLGEVTSWKKLLGQS